MYLVIVALFMFVLPTGSIAVDLVTGTPLPVMALVGKWFVFWAVGIRLLTAGVRQIAQPSFTAREIFHTKSDEVLPLVSELGIANVAMGAVGVASIVMPGFVLPSAITGAIFLGIAGLRHIAERDKSFNENLAMVSDLFVAAVLAAFAVWALL